MPVAVPSDLRQAVTLPLIPSLYAGATTGAAGILVGSLVATAKGVHAGLFSVAAGAQCFVLGSTFWYSRNALTLALGHRRHTPQDDLLYSTAAGSISGAAAGALRSRRNIIPGAIMMAVCGCAGQAGINILFRRLDSQEQSRPFLDRLSDSRWWPLKSVSDDDYEKLLNEKILAIDAEMSLINDRIAMLREQEKATPANSK